MIAMPQAAQANPDFTTEVAERTAPIYQRVKNVFSDDEWVHLAPYVDEIERLKKERNAIILAHNYQTRDIFHCVSDIVGDSLALAKKATEVDADVIVLAGVHFMAETTKILNPSKTVLIPDPLAGCSLAESITADDILKMRTLYPGVPVVTYVNTSADVKAVSDVTCTSANAKQVVESLGVERVMLFPDEFLAQNVAAETEVEIITFPGRCEVHEQFSAQQVEDLRRTYPAVTVLAHPECPPEVLQKADFSGSTSGMANYVTENKPEQVALITECSMSDNLVAGNPETNFIRSCSLCPHMQRITLPKIIDSLTNMTVEVTVDEAVAIEAKKALDNMLAVGRG